MGVIPIDIFVGDDHQIPPIGFGAFYALDGITFKNSTKVKSGQMEGRINGFEEFKMFGRNVVYLHGVKRVNNEQDQLRRTLQGLCCEDNEEGLSGEDIPRLLELDILTCVFQKVKEKKLKQHPCTCSQTRNPKMH